jgi:hypothetical protein
MSSNPVYPETLLAIMSTMILLATAVSGAQTMLESVTRLWLNSPKWTMLAIGLGAWFIAANALILAFTFAPVTTLQVSYRAALVYGASSMIVGPSFLFPPSVDRAWILNDSNDKPNRCGCRCAISAFIGATKRWKRLTMTLYVLATCAQGFVVYAIYALLRQVYLVDLLYYVAIPLGYLLACMLFSAAFYFNLMFDDASSKSLAIGTGSVAPSPSSTTIPITAPSTPSSLSQVSIAQLFLVCDSTTYPST